MAARDAAAATAAPPSRLIALVQADGQRIGIDGECVVRAVAVPADMVPLPRRAGGIAGVISHAGRPLPVIRLDYWLQSRESAPAPGAAAAYGESVPQTPAARPAPLAPEDVVAPLPSEARIVVLQDGSQAVGLLVDAVIGMQRCAESAIVRICHDDDADELFACAALLEAGAPALLLLEAPRLVALARAWTDAAQIAGADAPRADVARRHADIGVFRIGDALIGIGACDIGELLPMPPLRPPPLQHTATRGLFDWRGRLLPLVDLTAALGAIADAASARWLCVVRHRDRALGVVVHEILGLQALDGPSQTDPAGLVRRQVPTPRGIVQLLDTAALIASAPESAISLQRGSERGSVARTTCPHTYVVFEAAGRYATRIDCVQELLTLPVAMRSRLAAGLAVSLSWRGHAVPVRGLFAEGKRCIAPEQARQLIVIGVGERRAAIPIEGVQAIIAPHTATRTRMRLGPSVVEVLSTAVHAQPAATLVLVELEPRALVDEKLRTAAMDRGALSPCPARSAAVC